MGKTTKAGKWIRNLLLGKRSTKSNLSKREHILKSSEINVSNGTLDSSWISTASGEICVPAGDKELICGSSSEDVTPAMEKGADLEAITQLGSQEFNEIMRHEEAAIKAQAVFRGYLARRAFRTLKGIVQLQAHIRCHLVRKQAVSTLYCLNGIVKFQALARGYKVRNSDIGLAVQKIHKRAKHSNSTGVMFTLPVDLSKSPFTSRLVSSSNSFHVLLKYNSEDPNSAWLWLQRWTNSRYLEFLLKPKKHLDAALYERNDSFKPVEADQRQLRRNVRKVSSKKFENGSIGSSIDSEKSKQHRRKVPGHQQQSVQDRSKSGVTKVKPKSREISGNSRNLSDCLEVANLKRKQVAEKTPESTEPSILEHGAGGSDEKMKVMTAAESERFDVEESQNLHLNDGQMSDLHNDPANFETNLTCGSKGSREINLHCSHNCIADEDDKPSQRRASLPAKFDYQENGVRHSPRLPSYMAPTESVKARLRGQDSPKLSPDFVDKIGASRWNSLSTSANEKISSSSSPRVEPVLTMNGKGAIRTDRTVSSFRDNGKVIQPEWRR